MIRRALVILLVLQGCRGDATSPPGKTVVQTTTTSVTFNPDYWQEQAQLQSPKWKEAMKRCQEPESRHDPNCAVVLYTELIRNLEEIAEQPFPEYPRSLADGAPLPSPDTPAEGPPQE